ncbi:hypothetical protein AAHE18_18G142600 [Arachis hypogaea]
MKVFHLLLFDGSLIFPECILIFGLILLLMIDSTSDKKDLSWFYLISSTSLVMSITALLFRWGEEPMISFSGNFQMNNFNEIFQFLILLCSTLCIPLSVEYIECTEMALTEFLLFVLTATLGGIFLCGANDLITIFVAPECFSLCSYLLSGYTKKDVRSNEATTKYLLMGGASSSILVHGFSWLYGSSGGEIELQEIVNGLINTQMYNSPGISKKKCGKEVINWGLSRPMLRASGIQWDLHKVKNYECYGEFDWDVQWQKEGDSLARYLV